MTEPDVPRSTEAWAAPTFGDCARGRLSSDGSSCTFKTDDGSILFSQPLCRMLVRFPWHLRDEGFHLCDGGRNYVVFFSDPRSGTSRDAGRLAYRFWRRFFDAR